MGYYKKILIDSWLAYIQKCIHVYNIHTCFPIISTYDRIRILETLGWAFLNLFFKIYNSIQFHDENCFAFYLISNLNLKFEIPDLVL